MPDSKRVQIKNKVGERLTDNVTTLQHVEVVRKITAVSREDVPYPAAFIFGEEEIRKENPEIGSEEWDWNLSIEIWADASTNMEALLKDIHAALSADGDDFTLGGLVHWVARTGMEPFIVSTDEEVQVMLIRYQVTYSHPQGVM